MGCRGALCRFFSCKTMDAPRFSGGGVFLLHPIFYLCDMKRIVYLFVLVTLAFVQSVRADEGMWMIQQLSVVEHQMRQAGLKLPLSKIYNPQGGALSDAVVAIDGGTGTGSMISRNGLMITNHHVAYGDICAVSTLTHNYLEEGFWARSRAEEIPIKGKTVSFLRRVEEVTSEADALREEMKREGHWGPMSMRRLYAELERRYAGKTDLEVSCVSMWSGLKFYMYFYEVYRDVRLVGVPPRRIGAFGGEYDNWGWPQHKGDFALYRVYADRKGRPADYSAENVPLHPEKVLEISTRGIREGDFTMVIGFPGRTNRYASSYEIEERETLKNPIVVANRHQRMDIIRRNMQRSEEIRLKYSDAFFSLSNFADLVKWENVCLGRYKVSDLRREEERTLEKWIETNNPKSRGLLEHLRQGYAARRDAERDLNYLREAWLGPSEALLTANRVGVYLAKLRRLKTPPVSVSSDEIRKLVSFGHFVRNYDARTDRELFVNMVNVFTKNVSREMWGEGMQQMFDRFGGNAAQMAEDAFDRSFCSDADRFREYFGEDRPIGEVESDPLVMLARSVSIPRFTGAVNRAERKAGESLHACEKAYTHALYAFRQAQDIPQYPDANSTMRLTYGRVGGLVPRDGVIYDCRSTVCGYLEKYDSARHEYQVDSLLRGLIVRRAWGRWGDHDKMTVNFLTNNDITGGNSGSPVLDAKGRLIGLAFDGNRESMAVDLYFHPELARTVCVDIRFVMWCIEHYAGAGDLLREMKFR